ncbi:hypothetical protein L345_01567, partial [Ophiophagus hannah]
MRWEGGRGREAVTFRVCLGSVRRRVVVLIIQVGEIPRDGESLQKLLLLDPHLGKETLRPWGEEEEANGPRFKGWGGEEKNLAELCSSGTDSGEATNQTRLVTLEYVLMQRYIGKPSSLRGRGSTTHKAPQTTFAPRLTQFPEPGHQVDKGGCPITQPAPELVAQGQEVMGNVHAVVMVNGSQLGKLLKKRKKRGRGCLENVGATYDPVLRVRMAAEPLRSRDTPSLTTGSSLWLAAALQCHTSTSHPGFFAGFWPSGPLSGKNIRRNKWVCLTAMAMDGHHSLMIHGHHVAEEMEDVPYQVEELDAAAREEERGAGSHLLFQTFKRGGVASCNPGPPTFTPPRTQRQGVAMVWEGLNVGKTGGAMLGESHPADSKPGTMHGDFLAFKWAGTSFMAGGFCGEGAT